MDATATEKTKSGYTKDTYIVSKTGLFDRIHILIALHIHFLDTVVTNKHILEPIRKQEK